MPPAASESMCGVLERPAAAMDVPQADVVGEDEDDVRPPEQGGGFGRPGGHRRTVARIDTSIAMIVRCMGNSFR